MSRSEIADKINSRLGGSAWGEPLVVYFLVQIRKLLDHQGLNRDKYSNLRFFCDWVVHISKDHLDASTLKLLRGLQSDIEKQIASPTQEAGRAPIDFAYFEHLKPELLKVLKEEDISTDSLDNEAKWVEFISVLVKVLENQPLVVKKSYGLNIKNLVFLPSKDSVVIMQVNFNDPIKGRDGKDNHFFRLTNIY